MVILLIAIGTVFVAAAFNLFMKAPEITYFWIIAPMCLVIGLGAFIKAYVREGKEEKQRKQLEADRERREEAREQREQAREEREKIRFENEKTMWEKVGLITPNNTKKGNQP